jgi:hypothetical protein
LYPATAELALEIGHFGKAFCCCCWVGFCEINYSFAWAENKRLKVLKISGLLIASPIK